MCRMRSRAGGIGPIARVVFGAGLVLACAGSEVTRPDRGLRLGVRPDSMLAGANGGIVISIDIFRDGQRVTDLRPTARSTNPAVASVTPDPIAGTDVLGAPMVIVQTHDQLGDALIIASVEDGATRLADTAVINVRHRLIG